MNTQTHEPVYRAAADMAYAELRQIDERFNQLRMRHEQISKAAEALKLVVGSLEPLAMPNRPASKPVQEYEKVQATA